tara:strand:+ start:19580 stop:19900 length:321 start_codon:yes stop_codon:yes gene_type:complete
MKGNLKKLVKSIIISNNIAKDNDIFLAFKVYESLDKDFKPPNKKPMTVVDFFTKLHKGSLPSYDSIIRVRRYLNQHYPDTRGTSYLARQSKANKKRKYFKKKLKEE